MPISAPWTTWWQEDLPCRFSQNDAVNNRDFLTSLFGHEWLQKSLQPLSTHPLISLWMTNGVHAFLILNALAEDSRILAGVSGFSRVVSDLKDGKRCWPSWHVIRTAAMFQRAGVAVCEFYDQNDKLVPDFLIEYKSAELDVEAKVLLGSDHEKDFKDYAEPLLEKVFSEAMEYEAVHPPVTIVIKSGDALPNHTEVLDAVSTLLRDSGSPPKDLRGAAFNVFVDPPPAGSGLFRLCDILCPRSDKENLRVEDRVRHASHQLLSEHSAESPGLLSLGITPTQNAPVISRLLNRRFAEGRYPGVSAVLLTQSGTHLEQPRRTVSDFVTGFRNPRSQKPLPFFVPIKPLDLTGDLMAIHNSEPGIPAYRVGAVESRDPNMLALPCRRRVDEGSLR